MVVVKWVKIRSRARILVYLALCLMGKNKGTERVKITLSGNEVVRI